MNVGIFLPTMAPDSERPDHVVAAARQAEALGFESVWAVDQLVAGTGVAIVDSTVALAAAAGATATIGLGYGVLIAPLRPAVWAAKQVASLQLVSGNRVLLGVGVGGDRHDRSWDAAGVPRNERGRRTDELLAALPGLLAGKPTDVGGRAVELAPGVTMPPILVGGAADAALVRTVRYGDGWFGLPLRREQLVPVLDRLGQLADDAGKPRPAVTGSVMVALDGDATVPDNAAIARILTDPDGLFGMPPEAVPGMLLRNAGELGERLAMWSELGAERVVLTVGAGDWFRQAELVAATVQ
jgi:alkanesulfonate monooxygenase SsuD/methylene tetrahydromethanopterin reductase-like flavin-dependent oxidoreductase (luciferase family)